MFVHFSILLIVIILNLIPKNEVWRKEKALPVSFAIITGFLAIRFNYGTDYLSYHDIFYYNANYAEVTNYEWIFWKIFFSFTKYYQFVVFHTLALCGTLFFFVRKYVPPKYYALFFLLFLTNVGMVYNMIAAMRSGLAACAFLWSTEFFLLRRKNFLLYAICIYFCSAIHKSAILLELLIPFLLFFKNRNVNSFRVSMFFIFCLIASYFLTDWFSELLNSSSSMIEGVDKYSDYIENGRLKGSSIGLLILNAMYAPLALYLTKNSQYVGKEMEFIYKVSVFYFVIRFIGIDFQSRYAVIMMTLVVVALCDLMNRSSPRVKIIVLLPLLLSSFYSTYFMYSTLLANPDIQGNFIFYQTIFSLPQFP